MDRRDVEQLFANLSEDEFGWQVAVPERFGRFLGKSIRIEFETRAIEEDDDSPPKPSSQEKALATKILGSLAAILAEAEKQFTRYTADSDPEAREQIRDPHIWICRDDFEDDEDMEHWTLVVGREDAPDFGYHIEFDGSRCLDIWGGD